MSWADRRPQLRHPRLSRRRMAHDVRTTRGYNWEGSVSVQHELAKNVSVNVAYFRRSYGNLTVTQNTRVTNANYSLVLHHRAATDPRLTGGRGELCGLYDRERPRRPELQPDPVGRSFGKSEDVLRRHRRQRECADAAGHRRAGWGQQRSRADEQLLCVERSQPRGTSGTGTPHTEPYCDVRPPFQPNVKALVVVPAALVGIADERDVSGPARTADPGDRRDPQLRRSRRRWAAT